MAGYSDQASFRNHAGDGRGGLKPPGLLALSAGGTSPITLSHFLHDYYAPLKGISTRTQQLYGFTIKSLGEYLGEVDGSGYREPTVLDLDQLSISRYLAWRLRHREPATAAKDRAQLRAIWALAWDQAIEGVSRGPSAGLRRIVVPQRTPEAWLSDEMRRLVASAAHEVGEIEGVPAAGFWRALLLTMYDSAERISACLSLRYADVHGTLVIMRAEGRKGGRRDLTRSITSDTALAIDQIAMPRRELVFPWKMSVSTIYYHLDRILDRANLPKDRRSKFHRIRRTSASYYEAAGGDAQELLDHSTPALKRRHYLDPRIVGDATNASAMLPKVS